MGEYPRGVDDFARRNLPPAHLWPEMINLERFGYPERLNCAAELLDNAVAEGYGERSCLRCVDIDWSYAETQAQVNRIANFLVNECNLLPGERVMLGGPNTPMMAAGWLAIIKAGGIAVATMALLRPGELAGIAEKARARIALCDAAIEDAYAGAMERAPSLQVMSVFNGGELEQVLEQHSPDFQAVDTAADDVCLIAFTSGTTGKPKGCMHFHRDVMTICETVGRQLLQPAPDDVFIGSPPLAFTFGLGGLLLFPLYARATAVMLDKPAPANLAEAIGRFRATVCFTAPTAYRAMLLEMDQYDFSSLRKTVSAGEALPRATFDAWLDATGIRMIDGIGATELLHIFISAAGDDIRPGATGRPLPSWEARIVDEQGNELPDGKVGRLLVRGPIGCRYLDDPRQANYIVDGWNCTGDAFIRDSDGYFWFQSRADDMIISSGYNIAGPEVEDALLTHAAVAEAAVVGIPDAERGAIAKAFVVVAQGVVDDNNLVKTLQAHVKKAIAPYKYPRAIEFVDALPKTDTGKIQRFKLRNR